MTSPAGHSLRMTWSIKWTPLKIFTEYNQQAGTFHNLFISVRRSTCFRRFFHPSSGAQNCTYSVRYWSDQYLMLYVQFWAPEDGWKNRLKHMERLTEINKFWNVAACWLYSVNILAMHRPMNVKPIKILHCPLLGYQCCIPLSQL